MSNYDIAKEEILAAVREKKATGVQFRRGNLGVNSSFRTGLYKATTDCGGCCGIGAYLIGKKPFVGLDAYETAAKLLKIPMEWIYGFIAGFDNDEYSGKMSNISELGYEAGREAARIAFDEE